MSSLVLLFFILSLCFSSISADSCEGRRVSRHAKDLSPSSPHSGKYDAKMKIDETATTVKPTTVGRKCVPAGAAQIPSASRVSLCFPYCHGGQKEHPGFHVDYAEPHPNPPSSN